MFESIKFSFVVKFSDSFCLALVTGVNDFCVVLIYPFLDKIIIFQFSESRCFFDFTQKTKIPNSSEVAEQLKREFDKKLIFSYLGPEITY